MLEEEPTGSSERSPPETASPAREITYEPFFDDLPAGGMDEDWLEAVEVTEAIGKLEQEVEIDKVAARVKDAAREGVEWLIYEKKFVARVEGTRLQSFAEFLLVRDLEEIKVNNLAFTTDYVWVATGKGAYCYERHVGGWVEYAVNRKHIGMPVDSISVDAGDVITFRMKVDDREKVYTLNTKTSEWAEMK